MRLPEASPKSVTATRPLLSSSTFSGLKSRWTMPPACAAASASPAVRKTSRMASSERGSAWSHVASVCPATSSIEMYARPSASPVSYTVTMFGWARRAMSRASRARRAAAS